MAARARTVMITGASAGLGKALAIAYAAPDRTLGLVARNAERLDNVAAQCRARAANVKTGTADVTDGASIAAWIRDLDAQHPIDLLIVNAGAFTGHGPDGAVETPEQIAQMVRTNLEGAMMTITAALPMMRARKSGRIAIVGSLAALHPLADAPAYSASKAGVMGYGEALREWLIPDNIAVSLIYPGHIDTGQVANHIGKLPLLMTADAAARKIKRDLDRGRSFIAFPLPLLWLIRAGRMLPWRLRARLGQDQRFHVADG